MFFVMSLITFCVSAFTSNEMILIASAFFAIASAIEQFTYKYFKNK